MTIIRFCLLVFPFSSMLALTSAPVSARAIEDDDWCRGGRYVNDNQPLGAGVVGRGGTQAYDDTSMCHLNGPSCRSARLPPGVHVLLGRHRDGLICVYFPNGPDTITGWVKANAVKAKPIDRNPPLRAWLGLWTADGDPAADPNVRFLVRKGAFIVKGHSWTNGPEEHIGSLDEKVHRSGYRAFDARCEVAFWLVGQFLVATDDQSDCIASGAGFSGVYTLKHR